MSVKRKSSANKYCLVIPGRGYAPRAQHAPHYKEIIRKIGQKRIPQPFHGEVIIRIEYLYSSHRHLLDSDNLSKTICDALKGVAYKDDSQVIHKEITLIDRKSDFSIKGVPLTLQIADLFANKESFTIIRLHKVVQESNAQNTLIEGSNDEKV